LSDGGEKIFEAVSRALRSLRERLQQLTLARRVGTIWSRLVRVGLRGNGHPLVCDPPLFGVPVFRLRGTRRQLRDQVGNGADLLVEDEVDEAELFADVFDLFQEEDFAKDVDEFVVLIAAPILETRLEVLQQVRAPFALVREYQSMHDSQTYAIPNRPLKKLDELEQLAERPRRIEERAEAVSRDERGHLVRRVDLGSILRIELGQDAADHVSLLPIVESVVLVFVFDLPLSRKARDHDFFLGQSRHSDSGLPTAVVENPQPQLVHHEDLWWLVSLFEISVNDLVAVVLFGVVPIVIELV
jgi:hypothetical protein